MVEFDKRALVKNGFMQVSGLVPRPRIAAAIRELNHWLGYRRTRPAGQSGEEEIMTSPAFLDLFYKTQISAVAEVLLGPGRIEPVAMAQAVLRFPLLERSDFKPDLHIDEFVPPYRGDERIRIPSFTMLVCVLLSDLPEPFSGNFLVSPGSHRRIAAHIREKGFKSLDPGLPQRLDLPKPRQITGKAGDVVFCHYLLAHDREQNLSSNIRYAVFFRLLRIGHRERQAQALTGIWSEWPGLGSPGLPLP